MVFNCFLFCLFVFVLFLQLRYFCPLFFTWSCPLSFCPLYPLNLTLHLFFLFLSFCFSLPSVTIATEERPFIEKGIRLAGPPSHLAWRGGWGGGRSSGSMFESNPLPLFYHSLLTSDPSASLSAPNRWSCEAAWACCATDFWPTYWAAHDTI